MSEKPVETREAEIERERRLREEWVDIWREIEEIEKWA